MIARFAMAALVVSLMGLGFVGRPAPARAQEADVPVPENAEQAAVTGWVDGEHFMARVGDAQEEITLIGADAPETDKWECGAFTAADRLVDLAPKDGTVYLVRGSKDRDKKHRLLRYVWTPTSDGGAIFVNAQMLREGLAGFNAPDKGNEQYADQLKAAEAAAKQERVGIWTDDCGGPHEKISPCQPVADDVVELIAAGLKPEVQGWLRGAQAVRSPSYRSVYLVAADIEGPVTQGTQDTGVWAVIGNIDSAGSVLGIEAMKGFASTFSDFKAMGTLDTMDTQGYKEALDCSRNALKS